MLGIKSIFFHKSPLIVQSSTIQSRGGVLSDFFDSQR
jgi:hypothetical protein